MSVRIEYESTILEEQSRYGLLRIGKEALFLWRLTTGLAIFTVYIGCLLWLDGEFLKLVGVVFFGLILSFLPSYRLLSLMRHSRAMLEAAGIPARDVAEFKYWQPQSPDGEVVIWSDGEIPIRVPCFDREDCKHTVAALRTAGVRKSPNGPKFPIKSITPT